MSTLCSKAETTVYHLVDVIINVALIYVVWPKNSIYGGLGGGEGSILIKNNSKGRKHITKQLRTEKFVVYASTLGWSM